MAIDLEFVEFVVGQMESAGTITFRQMFGGCTLYCDGKVVALVCDNQLFIKPTEAGRKFMGEVVEAPPYSGAKPFFLIENERENSRWLSELIAVSAKELPAPKPKRKR